MFTTKPVKMIVCHGGPAEHFANYAKVLEQQGHTVEIEANGPALTKLTDIDLNVKAFSLLPNSGTSNRLPQDVIADCNNAALVMTDVGHEKDAYFQQVLSERFPHIPRVAYYDNPDSYVPGGYSEIAAKVMNLSNVAQFANANLASDPIYQQPNVELDLSQTRIGVGYYPLESSKDIIEKRKIAHEKMKAGFLSQIGLPTDTKIYVYFGANNSEYFENAFPLFIELLTQIKYDPYVKNSLILLQQHPGAITSGLDSQLLLNWNNKSDQENLPKVMLSNLTNEQAQIITDVVFYYQTSMAAQFVLAGIPVIQIGNDCFRNLLITNNCVETASNSSQLIEFLRKISLQTTASTISARLLILKYLGFREDWQDRFTKQVEDLISAE